MGESILIPFCLETNNVLLPRYIGQFDGKYVYNLFSPFNGRDLKESVKYVPINIEIIIPVGVTTQLKQVHYEENGSYVRDERLDRGLVPLQEGKTYKLKVIIPKQMDKSTLVRGQLIGSLIFDKNVELIRFWSSVQHNNLLKFKRLTEKAFKPVQMEGSAGIDLPSANKYELKPHQQIKININLAISLPKGFYGLILGRSGLADRYGIEVLGGVIDNSYRGEIFVILYNHGTNTFFINQGDRIAQLVVAPYTRCVLVECELDQTIRGTNGMGSTGLEPIIKPCSWNTSKPQTPSLDDLVGSDTISLSSETSVCDGSKNYPDYELFE